MPKTSEDITAAECQVILALRDIPKERLEVLEAMGTVTIAMGRPDRHTADWGDEIYFAFHALMTEREG
jgi:hypothetical protein